MNSCDCYDCRNHIRHLESQVRELESALERAKRDTQDEVDRLNRRIDALRSDLNDVYAA
jgi:hypothetical protein